MVWSPRGKGCGTVKKESLPFGKWELISRLEFLHMTGKPEPCTQFESVWTYFPGGMIFLPGHLPIMRNETVIYIQETDLQFEVQETIPWPKVSVSKTCLTQCCGLAVLYGSGGGCYSCAPCSSIWYEFVLMTPLPLISVLGLLRHTASSVFCMWTLALWILLI